MVIVMDIPLSPYAQKVKLALLEKGVAFETRVPNVDDPDPEFRALSPRLEVPALIDGDFGAVRFVDHRRVHRGALAGAAAPAARAARTRARAHARGDLRHRLRRGDVGRRRV